MAPRSEIEVLAETVQVSGRDVLDVGCGAGALVRWLAQQGARVVGAECGAAMRSQALRADPDHPHRYVDAPGEDLPFGDARFDLLIYSHSLHHVPAALVAQALHEARRVLRTGGILYVVEPDPRDRDYAVGYPVTDEQAQLALVASLLKEPGRFGFTNPRSSTYDREDAYPDFETWEQEAIAVEPDLAALMDQHREQIRERFHRLAQRHNDKFVFAGVNHLTLLPAT